VKAALGHDRGPVRQAFIFALRSNGMNGQKAGIPPKRMHQYIVGATKTGKTNYILDTIEEPFRFIDKHGNAARDLADKKSQKFRLV
jgi:hypothetical protein